jgi:DNA-binding NarL/FixJ family response regulator
MTKIAIIEDEDTIRQMLVQLINNTPEYCCVCACSTSAAALIEVPKHEPDVVLMDIHLPDESGIVCTARLTEKMPNLQVIIVTVYKDTKLIFQALKAGACGYILKRFPPEQIIQAIAEARSGGAPMTPEIARMLVRSMREPSAVLGGEGLTAREVQILVLVAEGLTNKEIALKTGITHLTVRNHLEHIFKKLHVRTRTEAASKYLRPGSG